MWIQDDMIKFLESMASLAAIFLKSIPGEAEVARLENNKLYSSSNEQNRIAYPNPYNPD